MRFHDIASSGQVREGVVRRVLVDGVEIVVLRSAGRVCALANFCTHEGCRLSNGRVTPRGLRCSCHGSVFDLETGSPLTPPADRPLRVFPVRESDGRIRVGIESSSDQAPGPALTEPEG